MNVQHFCFVFYETESRRATQKSGNILYFVTECAYVQFIYVYCSRGLGQAFLLIISCCEPYIYFEWRVR